MRAKKTWGGARPGAGPKPERPEEGSLVKTSVQLPPSLVEVADRMVSEGKAKSRSAAVVQLAELGVKGLSS
jgi:hypothetical protein